jgi:hypothetical protein
MPQGRRVKEERGKKCEKEELEEGWMKKKKGKK